ncbi:HTH_Tnp_Tc3_2 domain-containing protein [Trichonephila clavata]|uniref:HTH_Tnp_Tc3_2 domain-containing protein n=1 Tax=Trichonephila clavata TaxID=2740835 RepID=A0A8X6FSA5_TRICU|nr:HTH_Tnp_Tc3_2 domain-containing protein [Trichonephila clavata]
MENRKETMIEEIKLAIKLSNEGKSLRNIAKVVGRSVNCIQQILQKFKKTGMLANTEGRGRNKIMNSITERRVIHQVKIDPKISAPKIAASTSNTLGRSVSAETVRRVLRKAGYNGRVARKKPLIVSLCFFLFGRSHPSRANNKELYIFYLIQPEGTQASWKYPYMHPLKYRSI